MKFIKIRKAKTHNLKSINVDIPKSKITVITGPSGSGKSTLAFDVLYAESQRRYLESLSAYARQFLEKIERPDVESIEGLSPAISIDQKSISVNPRSTVGTITEIYDYIRLLFAHIGEAYCYSCGRKITKQDPQAIVDKIASKLERKLLILAPIAINKKGAFKHEFEQFRKDGFVRVLVDGEERLLEEDIELDKNKKHDIYLVVDRVKIKENSKGRIAEAIELALKVGKGVVTVKDMETNNTELFSEHFSCPYCGINYKPITPQSFSFNSPLGACPECYGLGIKHQLDLDKVMPDKSLSVREGVIKLWRRPKYYFYQRFLIEACRKFGIDIYLPFEELPRQHQDIILFGNPGEVVEFEVTAGKKIRREFRGVINLLLEQFNQTDSPKVKSEITSLMQEVTCPACGGDRLNKESLSVKIMGKNIMDVSKLKVSDAYEFFLELERQLNPMQLEISKRVLTEIKARLKFLIDVGLDYLSLNRSASTLSGGEAQRIRLATQAGSSLSGITYVMDEPSIGLHPRDTSRLVETLKHLRDNDNTVVVVEHDSYIIEAADYIVDMGPASGRLGGEVVACGSLNEIEQNEKSLTGKYLSGKLKIEPPKNYKKPIHFLKIKGANVHNLKGIDVDLPLGVFVCISGVSGSGKSSLVFDCFHEYATKAKMGLKSDVCEKIEGLERIDKIIKIDQSPIGRTPRSNPATYTSVFTDIRELFAQTEDAKLQGFTASRFSFNVKGGRCEKCKGEGYIRIEMQFLADVYVKCDVCGGKRYNEATLNVKYKGKSIYDVLEMTINQAYEFFENIPKIRRKLSILRDVGLGYLQLGQPATTLSGGEAQRIKIAKNLIIPPMGHTLYLLDEPSIGLHMDDVKKLIEVLKRLVDEGNSVVVIEHNIDILKSADYILDIGPDSADKGGRVVAFGTPIGVATKFDTYTSYYLRKALGI
ncbi:excinuclease ABC subunit UvrA [Hippea maritima]|uniref:UvrABC system protein A n=1 Tax=Hippea maritima (strain ATCC 700847 / DSM 10411 / MH2) TaxID=760142 RepID=F2LU71_HIPMA|nr:excinuclease ABC subunit UvrA [Hippea maritima]AEA34534.1 excinuclease ABC, A subunit [Hippea maritima DSM 10411]